MLVKTMLAKKKLGSYNGRHNIEQNGIAGVSISHITTKQNGFPSPRQCFTYNDYIHQFDIHDWCERQLISSRLWIILPNLQAIRGDKYSTCQGSEKLGVTTEAKRIARNPTVYQKPPEGALMRSGATIRNPHHWSHSSVLFNYVIFNQ